MTKFRIQRCLLAGSLIASMAWSACSNSSAQSSTTTTAPTPTPTAPTPTVTPKSLAAPVPVSPLTGSQAVIRPALTVVNAVRSGTLTGALTYTFDVSETSSFASVVASVSAPEGQGQTAAALTTDLGPGKTYYWRATAVGVTDGVTSPASEPQMVVTIDLTTAGKIAAVERLTLWPDVQPPGTPGQARLGEGWGVVQTFDFLGNAFLSPTLDDLRVFDLLDRGMDPNAISSWLRVNGYFTQAVYYGDVAQGVFGFPQNYLTLIGTQWTLVKRVGA